MKVLRDYVLVEEILTKSSKIITTVLHKVDDKDFYKSDKTIISLGEDTSVAPDGERSLKIGDKPIFNNYATPDYENIISGKLGDDRIIRHLAFKEELIIGVE